MARVAHVASASERRHSQRCPRSQRHARQLIPLQAYTDRQCRVMRRTRAIVVGFTVACVLGGLVVSHHLGLAQTGTALVVDSIPTPADNLSGLSFDGSSLWATVDESGTIYQADPETGKALRRLSF